MATNQVNKIFDERTIIVIDTSNYKPKYAEKVPFKAQVIDATDLIIHVRSLTTSKEYELYYNQVLEALDIEEILMLVDLREYGNG